MFGVFSGTPAMTTEICYTNLNARFKYQCRVVTDRDVEDFIKPNITQLILIFPSHCGPVTGRKVKSLTYSNHVSGPIVREKITVYELVKKTACLVETDSPLLRSQEPTQVRGLM